MLNFNIIGFYGKALFNVYKYKPKYLGEINWFMLFPYYFKYVFYNKTIFRKRLLIYNRKFSPKFIKRSYFITNIAFLLTFGVNFVFQRIALIFSNSGFFKNAWWEKAVSYSDLILDFFVWWCTKIKRLPVLSINVAFPYYSSFKKFFYWDPTLNFLSHKVSKIFLNNFGKQRFFYNANFFFILFFLVLN